MDEARVEALLQRARGGRVLVLTGAGISAESGIPTFRGPEGYWRVGSVNYRPEELATAAAFARMPEEVWAWYLHRRSVCRRAEPNAAHRAIAALERALKDAMALITQNVDGLHLRAGSSAERTFQIHGNLDWMRCSVECGAPMRPIPEAVGLDWPRGRALDAETAALLRCSDCGARTRPHVLWFDECYDEPRFRLDSSLRVASEAALLLVVGTTGQTTLPWRIGLLAARRGIGMIVVDPEPGAFTELAGCTPHGVWLRSRACEGIPALCRRIEEVWN
ncbi:MAG: RNA polymerase subunit sigma [Myxococcota bacterium]|nr:RNA polymerase subunit sigma [Myxococcota bacterium]MDW8361926.1 Sir2 family NAD-dependent protein deacetylase [Myxococcales bacterium]